MNIHAKKLLKRTAIAIPVLVFGLYFVPVLLGVWLVCGVIDVMRNKGRTTLLYNRYFLGNGIPTWLLSPFNLLVDLISYRNPGVYTLDDFPDDYRAEIEQVLEVFKTNKNRIIADIDAKFENGRRGMYVYRWYGKCFIDNVPELNKDFKFLKTIAVSVFSGKESTSFHFGPLRLSLRILYNLTPVETDQVYIECNGVKHYWHQNQLYIFDDTLLHRSVNEYDARRYNVFMDIIRPSPFPGVVSWMLAVVSRAVERINSIFYKNWTMISGAKTKI